jgi:serine/threonine-protein kinase
VAVVIVALGLGTGALAGWTARAPDLNSLAAGPGGSLPALWVAPRWAHIPKQGSAEAQFRYAQLQAPRDEWAAAWLAVPGYYPRSQDARARAYTHLARIWYRQADLDALESLRSELVQWKEALQREQDLAAIIRLAMALRKGDLDGVVKGFENQTDSGVADLHDPGLVALSLEICSDALQVAQRSGKATLAQPLRRAQGQLMRQLYRIEVGEPAGAGRANSAGRAASRSSGSGGSRRAWHS